MAFPYVRAQADWKNAASATGGGDTTTPLNEAALDTIEAGIASLSTVLETVNAKGDLLVATADNTYARLAVGTNDQVLVADSAQASGIKWAALPGGAYIAQAIVDAKGDLIVATAADTVARLAVGVDNQVLTADSAQASGMKWAAVPGGVFVGAKAYSDATQNVNNATAALTLNQEEYDSDGFHDNVTNNSRMTIPAALGGKYILSAGFFQDGGSTWIGFRKNGTTLLRGFQTTFGVSAYSTCTIHTDLVAGDYVECIMNTAGNINIGHATATDAQKWFAIAKL